MTKIDEIDCNFNDILLYNFNLTLISMGFYSIDKPCRFWFLTIYCKVDVIDFSLSENLGFMVLYFVSNDIGCF